MEGRLARNGRMGEGDRRGRQRLMSIAGGWEVTRQAGERGRCHEEAALMCTRLGAQQSPIPRLHGLQPLHCDDLHGNSFISFPLHLRSDVIDIAYGNISSSNSSMIEVIQQAS